MKGSVKATASMSILSAQIHTIITSDLQGYFSNQMLTSHQLKRNPKEAFQLSTGVTFQLEEILFKFAGSNQCFD